MVNFELKQSQGLHRSTPVILGALIAALCAGMSARAQDVVYSVYQASTTPIVSSGEVSPLSVTESGTITTDGTIGVLQTGDIVSWNLTLTDQYNPSYDVTLTPANSGIPGGIIGNALTASATALSFNYSDAGAAFAIQAFSPGFYSGYSYVCYQATTGGCAQGDTIVPNYYAVDGAQVPLSGNVNLNNPPGTTTSAPEIDSASMMSAGTLLLGMLAVMRGRRSNQFKRAVSPAV
jgi:hypothetical protein